MMFLTSSTQEYTMSGPQQNADSERQNLLDRLLDAVKQCQVRFGGKTELATDGDSRVVCLLTQFEAVFQHGFKKTRVSAFRQVGQVARIVKLDSEAVFWSFVKVHLSKLDEERFLSLQKATTDAGRGRAWLRSALNEHSLEKYFHHMLGNKTVLSQFYEKEAFLMDDERASMLPMIAAGLSSIVFALTVDNEELNVVRQPPPPLTINKEVLSGILPSFPNKPVAEPAPVYSAELTADDSKQEKRKKKKKKKRSAAIVSIEDDGHQDSESHADYFPRNDLSVKESTNLSSDLGKSSSLGRTRSSSYPGNIAVVPEGSTVKPSHVDGQEVVFTEIAKSISLLDNSVSLENGSEGSQTKGKNGLFKVKDFSENVMVKPRCDTLERDVQKVSKEEDTGNFVFGAVDSPTIKLLKQSNVNYQDMLPASRIQQNTSPVLSTNSVIAVDAPNVNQGSCKGKEMNLHQKPCDSGNESFASTVVTPNLTSAVVRPYRDDEVTLQKKQNADLHYGQGLTGDEDNESDFSCRQIRAAGRDENFTSSDHCMDKNKSHVPNPPSAQEPQAELDNALEKNVVQDRTAENADIFETARTNSAEFELLSSRVPESQTDANDSKVEPLVLMDSGECLLPVAEGDVMSQTGAESTFCYASDVSGEKDRDSLSSTSWSNLDNAEEISEHKDESLLSDGSVAAGSDATAAAAALAACSDAQIGMDNMASGGFSCMKETGANLGVHQDISKRHDGISPGELKQAIVSMMLKKDEIEEQNRTLRSQLDEERLKSEQLCIKSEQLQGELNTQENLSTAKIASLSRENELLKHQLKKYVGTVQALRNDLQGRSSETAETVLSGIRQDEFLPSLPPEEVAEHARLSEEAEEYKRKLIQVADLHGELLEFNERLHKQVHYYQHKVRRLREELVHLRGPLPDDAEGIEDDEASLSDFDPAVMSVGTRPLVNVWIPSVFLRGRASNVHHVYQVYVRIKDDEWNVYRRYSQFFDMHKSLRRRFPVVETFKFPPKKTLGNKDSLFVEDRRRLLQDYLRRVVNLYVTTDQQLRENTTKAVLLQIIPFFAEPFPPEKSKKESSLRRKRSLNYNGL